MAHHNISCHTKHRFFDSLDVVVVVAAARFPVHKICSAFTHSIFTKTVQTTIGPKEITDFLEIVFTLLRPSQHIHQNDFVANFTPSLAKKSIDTNIKAQFSFRMVPTEKKIENETKNLHDETQLI